MAISKHLAALGFVPALVASACFVPCATASPDFALWTLSLIHI